MPKVDPQKSIAVGFSQRGHDHPNTPLTIKENKFDSTKYGLVMAPGENPLTDSTGINQATHRMNIRVTCNTFKYNNVGLIGSGNLRDQVHSDTAATNFFNFKNTSNSMNENWDILWQEDLNGNAFNYILTQSVTDYAPNSGTGLNQNSIILNGNSSVSSDHQNDTSFTYYICEDSAQQKRAISKEKPQTSTVPLKVYPNPAQNKIHIALKTPARGYIRLQNMAGKTVAKTAFQQKETLTFETNHLASGVYFLRGRIEDRVIPPEKVVIMK